MEPEQHDRGGDLDLVPIDPDSWRLTDRRFDPHDSACVVAYIERVPGGFDVVWMHERTRPARWTSLTAILQAARTAPVTPTRGRRPVPIPHLRPV